MLLGRCEVACDAMAVILVYPLSVTHNTTGKSCLTSLHLRYKLIQTNHFRLLGELAIREAKQMGILRTHPLDGQPRNQPPMEPGTPSFVVASLEGYHRTEETEPGEPGTLSSLAVHQTSCYGLPSKVEYRFSRNTSWQSLTTGQTILT
ncbi:unnamed protein product [Caretta caretta]